MRRGGVVSEGTLHLLNLHPDVENVLRRRNVQNPEEVRDMDDHTLSVVFNKNASKIDHVKNALKAFDKRAAAGKPHPYTGDGKITESCTTTPGEKSVVWHEGIRYMFRNGMWATPRGYVWPNTDLCRTLDQKHEEHVESGKTYWEEDQQGVGIPQTVAGGKQFSGNVEDRKAELKIQGTPSKVHEGGRKPYAAGPFKAWGALTNADGTPNGGYERRLMDLFTRATYDGANAKPQTSESVDEAVSDEEWDNAAAEQHAHIRGAVDHHRRASKETDPVKKAHHLKKAEDYTSAAASYDHILGDAQGAREYIDKVVNPAKPVKKNSKNPLAAESVDEAKRGRPRDLIGVREYQGKGSPRKRIRRADGKWHWASKNRV
jgi:hypothetical protein